MKELAGVTSQEAYQGKPMQIFRGSFNLTPEKGAPVVMPVEIATHPNNTGRIIINIPGYNGVINGFDDKYLKLARHIQTTDLGSFVRIANPLPPRVPVDINLLAALQYARENAEQICNNPKPEIFLMGFSAGASAIAADAYKFPEVTKILLGAPSGDSGRYQIERGMPKFKGEVYIIIGENDDVVGKNAGKVFYDLATGASHREQFSLPNCDHQFTGEANGRIISEAPFYAFSKGQKPKFPDPFGGIKLYD